MNRGMEYLEKNLCDAIFEMMLKFNENHDSSICMYYTPDLAAYLLGCEIGSIYEDLSDFKKYTSEHLGKIDIETASDGRIGIRVYTDGIDHIMQSNPRRFFLKKLVEAIRNRECTIDTIKSIFAEESKDFVCDEVDNSEFQYVVYFKDENIDEYKYCFTFDVMGSYYHRLIAHDFESLIHDSCGLKH